MSLALKLYQQRSLDTLERFLEAARLEGPAKAFTATVEQGLVSHYKPLPDLESVPYVCLRIPTGGGKTVMGAHIIQAAGRAYLEREYPLVLWLVPTTQIKTQTLDAFRDPRHPYRQELDEAFEGKVAVFDIADIDQIRPADLITKMCMVVATFASFRVDSIEGRKVYAHMEALEPHFAGAVKQLPYLSKTDQGEVAYSFANLLALHKPLAITDEAHNATTDLSFEVYKRLSPKVVVELTATPDGSNSNILVSVSAFELKAENMIKLPVVLKEHNDEWPTAISASVARRKSLAKLALGEAEYIRPILLIQAESVRGAATVEEVKKHLMEVDKIAEAAIAIATGSQRELEGVDLFAKDCAIEVIITKQALKEGWDCSFAYVFCSVAQVKSSTDVQQLLGRVLRMPYAKRRKQEALNKAYAHVVSPSFGEAAAELTKSLANIGFNPIEAIGSVRKDSGSLPLTGGATALPPALPTTQIAVSSEPDLSGVPERDRSRVRFTPNPKGARGGVVEIVDAIDAATVDAIVAAVPEKKREDIKNTIEEHQVRTAAVKAPSERGEVFQVPRLCVMEQGELEFVDKGMVDADFRWDLLDSPADLASLRFNEDAMTFEVDLGDKKVEYHQVKEDAATYLPGFAQDRSIIDLHGWLDQNIRDNKIKQPVLREWIRRALEGLTERGFSLAQLLQGQFVLRRKLQEQLELAKHNAIAEGFQAALFAQSSEVVSSLEPGYAFLYPADMTLYPARTYYSGSYRFQNHYYPVPGDMRWRNDSGKETEEFHCARALDLLDAVKFWVRNLVDPTQFWMPLAHNRTYPDFVALLRDGRLFVVEYKGSDRFSNDDSKEKRAVGELWAARSQGNGVYLMAQKTDEQGRSVREQMLAAIGTP